MTGVDARRKRTGRHRARTGKDRGSATVLAVGLLAVLAVLALAAAGLGRAVHARGTAQAAADLGAVAAATALHAPTAEVDPCTVAERVVSANGARLTACRIAGRDVEVATTVVLIGAAWPVEGRSLNARAQARAGPEREAAWGSPGRLGVGSGAHGRRARHAGADRRRRDSTVIAPALSSGEFPFPHLGDCTQAGHPSAQPHETMASRVARTHSRAAR